MNKVKEHCILNILQVYIKGRIMKNAIIHKKERLCELIIRLKKLSTKTFNQLTHLISTIINLLVLFISYLAIPP